MEESKIWSKRKAYILNLLNWKGFITFVARSGREEFKNERFCCVLTSQARNATTAFGNLSPVAERSSCGNDRDPAAFFHFANLLSPCREIHFHFVFVLFFVGYHRIHLLCIIRTDNCHYHHYSSNLFASTNLCPGATSLVL